MMKSYYPGWDGKLVEVEVLAERIINGVMMADICAKEGKPFIAGHVIEYAVEAIVVKASDIIIK